MLRLVSLALLFYSPLCFASGNLESSFHLDFLFSDGLQSENLFQTLGSMRAAEEYSSSSRGLGLKKAAMDLEWLANPKLEVRARIRPDFQLRESQSYQEVDTRAGRVYVQQPQIELLDTYQVDYIAGNSFKVGLGVFEEFNPSLEMLPLEFGLEARLPRKFAAYYANWTSAALPTPSLNARANKTTEIRLWLFDGRQQRRELVVDGASDDKTPGSSDPYMGSAISLYSRLNPSTLFFLTLGYDDSKLEDGVKSEMFGKFEARLDLRISEKPVFLLWETSYSKENWKLSLEERTSLQQLSNQLSLSSPLSNNSALIVQLGLGKAQFPDSEQLNRKEVESGQFYQLGTSLNQAENITLMASLSSEIRTKVIDGVSSGAFRTDQRDQRSINRFALSLLVDL